MLNLSGIYLELDADDPSYWLSVFLWCWLNCFDENSSLLKWLLILEDMTVST